MSHNESVVASVGHMVLSVAAVVVLAALAEIRPDRQQIPIDQPVLHAAPTHNPRIDPGIRTLPGFEAELLYRPDLETEGSWVALCAGAGNRLYAADQYGTIYLVEPPAVDDFETNVQITALDVQLSGAQGLCWAFDALYVMASGRGLMRIIDSNDDDLPDQPELLVEMPEAGEHGTHAIVAAPDGKTLLFACGNHTALAPIDRSRVPQVWQEDLLLPRDNDPRGHAAGVMAPGGCIYRMNPDGSQLELIACGFRNTYDLAVRADGEIFTFDSDMEWDLGLPWYRPARLCHVVSGADFGWRHGSGKWRPWFEDSVPAVKDIGPASPTGMLFGTGLRFPQAYQRMLYMLDWTYGIIYAASLKPSGGSFQAEVQQFISGKPLPVCDATVGADGALYFITGGRRIQSGLYRVVYRGEQDTTPLVERFNPSYERAMRRQMEQLHRADAPAGAIGTIWTQIGHSDRFVRHAARIALEHQPVARWKDRALNERDPSRAVIALLALTRHGSADDRPAVFEALASIDVEQLDRARRLAWLRAWELALIRLGPPNPDERARAIEVLNGRFPSGDPLADELLATLLAALDAPDLIDRCLAMLDQGSSESPFEWAELAKQNDQYGSAIRSMIDSPPPTRQLHYARVLSFVAKGWTLPQRQKYLAFLARAASAGGGMSYRGYIERMRERTLATCTEEEREVLSALALPAAEAALPPIVLPRGPGRAWTVEEAVRAVQTGRGKRDFARGAGLYRAAMCANCHQINGMGANAGPDLTSVGNKYALPDLMRAIIDPGDAITDQYAITDIVLNDGRRLSGLIVSADEQAIELATNFMDAGATIRIERSAITTITRSSTSPMPPGLINAMNEDELRDFVAFVLSGANAQDERFK